MSLSPWPPPFLFPLSSSFLHLFSPSVSPPSLLPPQLPVPLGYRSTAGSQRLMFTLQQLLFFSLKTQAEPQNHTKLFHFCLILHSLSRQFTFKQRRFNVFMKKRFWKEVLQKRDEIICKIFLHFWRKNVFIVFLVMFSLLFHSFSAPIYSQGHTLTLTLIHTPTHIHTGLLW